MSASKNGTNPLLAKPRRRTVTIYDGDVEAELDDLLEQVDKAFDEEAKGGARRMAGGKTPADQLAEAYDARRAAADGIDMVLQAIPERRGRQLQDDCPPRPGNKRDEVWGFDQDRFLDLLVPAMLVDPVVTEEQWEEFREQVTSSAWSALRDAAYDLYNTGVDLPKLSAASLLQQMREADKRRRSATE